MLLLHCCAHILAHTLLVLHIHCSCMLNLHIAVRIHACTVVHTLIVLRIY